MKKSFVLAFSSCVCTSTLNVKKWLNIQSPEKMSLKFLEIMEIIVPANTELNNIYPMCW